MTIVPLKPKRIAQAITVALLTSGLYSTHLLAEDYNYNNTLYYSNIQDFSAYENVTITTTENGAMLKGFAVYVNSENYIFNNLIVNTKGWFADGIHSKNAGGNTLINGNYTSSTTGLSADGINLGRELTKTSTVTIKGDADIKATGIGIRANASAGTPTALATISIEGKTKVETTSIGSKSSGYGVFAGQDMEDSADAEVQGSAKIFLKGDASVSTKGKDAHGVFARAGGISR